MLENYISLVKVLICFIFVLVFWIMILYAKIVKEDHNMMSDAFYAFGMIGIVCFIIGFIVAVVMGILT